MNRTKPIRGECQHCGGPLEFPAEQIGAVAACPHCRKQTELMLARPPDEPTIPRRIVVWTLIAVLIMAGGLVASVIALKRAEHWAAGHRKPAVGVTETNAGSSQAR